MKEWVFQASEQDRGVLTVSMYEITPEKGNHERQTIRVELDVTELIRLQEAVNRALAYHLRLMA